MFMSDSPKVYDSVLYGYAFRGQWIWFNGLTNPTNSANSIAITVWKDYNCQTRTYLQRDTTKSTFSSAQQAVIKTETTKIKDLIENDVWGAAHTLII